jgi:small subunit ribosomal protein S20
MAHTISAKKRIRQTERRTDRNKARRSRIRTFIRKVEEALEAGNKGDAEVAFKEMMPEMHRGVSKGLLKKNTAARKLSRLSSRIKTL